MTLCKKEIVDLLSKQVIPCWESLGPVPKVTIDFGSGKKLHRTLGGNIVLYLLLPDGRVVDAFPGVYTSTDFLEELHPALDFVRDFGFDVPSDSITNWHVERTSLIRPAAGSKREYLEDVPSARDPWVIIDQTSGIDSDRYNVAGSNAGKAASESGLLRALGAKPLSAKPRDRKKVDPWIISEKNPDKLKAYDEFEKLTGQIEDLSKRPMTAGMLKSLFPNRQEIVQEDSKFNRKFTRSAVHLMFASSTRLPEINEVRDMIYKKILHIPIDDPYLGLSEMFPGSTPN